MYYDMDIALSRRILSDLILNGLDDADDMYEFIQELVHSQGDRVFSLDWDSGAPGAGAGTEQIYRIRTHFFTSSADFGLGGPYETFEEALRNSALGFSESGSILVGGATTGIFCSEWTDEELLLRLDLQECGPPAVVTLNDTQWYLETLEQEQQKLRKRTGR